MWLAQIFFKCDGKLVEVKHLDIAVRTDDHIGEEVGHEQRILCFLIIIVHNVTIPVQQRVVLAVEFADLTSEIQIIAGAAMMKIPARFQGVPSRDDLVVCSLENDIVFQQNTFFRYHTSAVNF